MVHGGDSEAAVPGRGSGKERDRTEAISHRIHTAGIRRKITPDQVRAIRIVLSGSHEDMVRVQDEGRLGEWCDDNL